MFRDHFLACYITDPSGLKLRHEIGMDIIAWECDYPHTDTTWPDSPEFAWKEFQDAGVTDEEIDKITWENACRVLRLGPVRAHAEGAGDGRGPPGAGHRRRHHADAARGVAQAQRGCRDRHLLTCAGRGRAHVPRPARHRDLRPRWPTANAVGAVVISHGVSRAPGRYDRFARALNDAGLHAYAIDHRGHGRTASATGKGRMGPAGGAALVDDLDHVVDLARDDGADLPCPAVRPLLGLVDRARLPHPTLDRLAGAVLCGFPASLVDLPVLGRGARHDHRRGDARHPVDVLSAFNDPFEPARTRFDWLSRDDVEVDAYLADPLCGDDMPLTQGFVADLFGVVGDAVGPTALAAITCPVFVIAGDRDPSGAMGENPKALEAALLDAGVTVERRLYPGARHELLNETNRDEVTADVIAWLRARRAEVAHSRVRSRQPATVLPHCRRRRRRAVFAPDGRPARRRSCAHASCRNPKPCSRPPDSWPPLVFSGSSPSRAIGLPPSTNGPLSPWPQKPSASSHDMVRNEKPS